VMGDSIVLSFQWRRWQLSIRFVCFFCAWPSIHKRNCLFPLISVCIVCCHTRRLNYFQCSVDSCLYVSDWQLFCPVVLNLRHLLSSMRVNLCASSDDGRDCRYVFDRSFIDCPGCSFRSVSHLTYTFSFFYCISLLVIAFLSISFCNICYRSRGWSIFRSMSVCVGCCRGMYDEDACFMFSIYQAVGRDIIFYRDVYI
jgi:hypothetical protein